MIGVGALGSLGEAGQTDPDSASSRAATVIDQRFGGTPGLLVLVTAVHGTVDTPAAEKIGETVTAQIKRQSYASNVTSYFHTHTAALRSSDKRSALVLARVGNANADKANPHLPDLMGLLHG